MNNDKLPIDFDKQAAKSYNASQARGSKALTSDLGRLSITDMHRHGLLSFQKQFQGSGHYSRKSLAINLEIPVPLRWVRIWYVCGLKPYNYLVDLIYTNPHYGGKRWWFRCPNLHCARRVGILYLGPEMACRHCHRLAYGTQNESCPLRLLSKSQKIHMRLGGDGRAPGDNIPPKPKGMHWKTYHRYLNRMVDAYQTSWAKITG